MTCPLHVRLKLVASPEVLIEEFASHTMFAVV